MSPTARKLGVIDVSWSPSAGTHNEAREVRALPTCSSRGAALATQDYVRVLSQSRRDASTTCCPH